MDNKYDKIFKENFDPLIPHLLEAVLKLQLPKLETIKDSGLKLPK